MANLCRLIGIMLIFLPTTNVLADIDLSSTLHCTYQRGQFLSSSEAENVHNSTPLNWTFNSLTTKNSMYMSGGDTGEVIAIPIDDGVAAYLPYGIGTHTFTIWKTGESIWNKQSNFVGTINSQHYLGSCKN